MPHPQEDPTSHYDQAGIAERYATTFDGMRPTPAQYARLDRFARLPPPRGVVLDSGCGTGRFASTLLERGLRAVGVDASRAMLRAARTRVHRGVFHTMDIRRLGFADAAFDGVWAVAVTLHLDPAGLAEALTEMRRVLKPGGILFLDTRTAQAETSIVEPSTEGGAMVVHCYPREPLVAALVEHGLKILREDQEPDGSRVRSTTCTFSRGRPRGDRGVCFWLFLRLRNSYIEVPT